MAQRVRVPQQSEGDALLAEAMKWLDKIEIKRLSSKKAELQKRIGEYLYARKKKG